MYPYACLQLQAFNLYRASTGLQTALDRITQPVLYYTFCDTTLSSKKSFPFRLNYLEQPSRCGFDIWMCAQFPHVLVWSSKKRKLRVGPLCLNHGLMRHDTIDDNRTTAFTLDHWLMNIHLN